VEDLEDSQDRTGQDMNGKMQASQSQPTIHSLTLKQRVFIAVLLFLGLLVSFVVVCFLDPSTSLTNPVSSSGVRIAEGAVDFG
jgi:hypothetical protein